MRRAARRDTNEGPIVEALRAAGASVTIIGEPVDLIVGYLGTTTLMEVKKPKGPRGGSSSARATSRGGDGTYTRAQLEWRASWKGAPPVTVRTPAEALAAIGAHQVQEVAGQPVEDKPAPAHASTGRPRPASDPARPQGPSDPGSRQRHSAAARPGKDPLRRAPATSDLPSDAVTAWDRWAERSLGEWTDEQIDAVPGVADDRAAPVPAGTEGKAQIDPDNDTEPAPPAGSRKP